LKTNEISLAENCKMTEAEEKYCSNSMIYKAGKECTCTLSLKSLSNASEFTLGTDAIVSAKYLPIALSGGNWPSCTHNKQPIRPVSTRGVHFIGNFQG
jgi:hypothetical protein